MTKGCKSHKIFCQSSNGKANYIIIGNMYTLVYRLHVYIHMPIASASLLRIIINNGFVQICINNHKHMHIYVHITGPGQAKGAKGLDGFRLHVVLSIHSFHLKPVTLCVRGGPNCCELVAVGGGIGMEETTSGKMKRLTSCRNTKTLHYVATGSALIKSSSNPHTHTLDTHTHKHMKDSNISEVWGSFN